MQADDFFASVEARQESAPNGYVAARQKLEAKREAASRPRETEEEIVKHTCQHCGRKFEREQGMRVHIARMHGNKAKVTEQEQATAPVITTTEPDQAVYPRHEREAMKERIDKAAEEARSSVSHETRTISVSVDVQNLEPVKALVREQRDTIVALVDRIIVLESRRIAPLTERLAHAIEKPALPYKLSRVAITAWAQGKAESRRRMDVMEWVRKAPEESLEAVRRLMEGDAA